MKANLFKHLQLKTAAALVVGLFATFTVNFAFAEGNLVRYEGRPAGSKCVMAGDSTLKKWTMETSIISGFMEVDPGFPESALSNPTAAKPKTTAFMPVRTFKSNSSSTMDTKMQNTLSVTNYPRFEYQLIELKPRSKPSDTGPLQFDALGTLTIVGKTLTNTMPVTIEKVNGNLKVVGSAVIKMSDYGVSPPVINLLALPDIKVYDDLAITFEWLLAPKAK